MKLKIQNNKFKYKIKNQKLIKKYKVTIKYYKIKYKV